MRSIAFVSLFMLGCTRPVDEAALVRKAVESLPKSLKPVETKDLPPVKAKFASSAIEVCQKIYPGLKSEKALGEPTMGLCPIQFGGQKLKIIKFPQPLIDGITGIFDEIDMGKAEGASADEPFKSYQKSAKLKNARFFAKYKNTSFPEKFALVREAICPKTDQELSTEFVEAATLCTARSFAETSFMQEKDSGPVRYKLGHFSVFAQAGITTFVGKDHQFSCSQTVDLCLDYVRGLGWTD